MHRNEDCKAGACPECFEQISSDPNIHASWLIRTAKALRAASSRVFRSSGVPPPLDFNSALREPKQHSVRDYFERGQTEISPAPADRRPDGAKVSIPSPTAPDPNESRKQFIHDRTHR